MCVYDIFMEEAVLKATPWEGVENEKQLNLGI